VKSEPTPETATDEELVQSIQTAAGFSESVVKQLWSIALNKDSDDIFGDEDTMATIGAITLDAKEGSNATSYSIKLDIVGADERPNMLQFKDIPYIFNEIDRILMSAELYWSYCKKTYKLPEFTLWRSDWGTLFIAGAPPTMKHIGVRIIHR
jgi:hypothetical protein